MTVCVKQFDPSRAEHAASDKHRLLPAEVKASLCKSAAEVEAKGSFWTRPLCPSLDRVLACGSPQDSWSRPLFPHELEEVLGTSDELHHDSRHPTLEKLTPREMMAADLDLVNDTLYVRNMDEGDTLTFRMGDQVHELSVNDLTTQFSASELSNIRAYGAGSNSLTIEGQTGKQDRFIGTADRAIMQSPGLTFRAYGFGAVNAEGGDANDRAYVYGTDGADQLDGTPESTTMSRADGTQVSVAQFGRVYAKGQGGSDSATLEDSSGDDRFSSRTNTDVLETPDSYQKLTDFQDVEVTAKNGGDDRAYQRGTNGDDLLILTEDSMVSRSESKKVAAHGFERSYAYAGAGDDEVRAYDAVFTETFEFDSEFASTGERNFLDGQKQLVRLYSNDFYRRAEGYTLTEAIRVSPERMAGSFSENGAVSINMEYEQGLREDFYVEQQRRGAELIEAGLATGHSQLTDAGIKMIQWGLDQQALDGGFPNCDDAVHSTTLFMRAVGHALLKFDEIPYAGFTDADRAGWLDGLTRMSDWVVDNQDLQPELNLEPFVHRYFLRAIAFRQAHQLTELQRFDGQARAYFNEAVTRLGRAPLLVESGGFDLSYQAFGLRLAADYHELTHEANDRAAIKQLFNGSFKAINDRIDENGIADMSDSSRANETGRSGRRKTFDYRNAIHAFLAGFKITNSQAYFDLAERTFNGSRS